ncbi:MAG TPA: MauE/DoxX family redox-associated membrane protein [Chryseolinea sp.]|nr:MauE/DoxX family redox-associated membrane protein [Chryseolinea sp.]
MKQKVAVEIISFLFILLFVYAATSKLADVEKFRIQIGQSPLLTDISYLISWTIPSIELIIAAMFVWVRFRLVALYSAFALMLMFTIYIVAIMTLSEQIPCACGGVLDRLGWKEH